MMQARIVATGLLFLCSSCNAFTSGNAHVGADSQSHTLDAVTVRTQSWEIRFSPIGGVPVEWNIIDPHYASAGGRENGGGGVPLIDVPSVGTGIERPFSLVFPDDELSKRVNEAHYTLEESRERGRRILSFSTYIPNLALEVVKRYSIPDTGFEARFTVTLSRPLSAADQADDERVNLGITLGPGLGAPAARLAGLSGSLYSYVDAFYRSGGEVSTVSIDGEEASIEFGTSDGPIQWGGLHNRYFMVALIPDSDASQGAAFQSGRVEVDSRLTELAGVAQEELSLYPRIVLFATAQVPATGRPVNFSYVVYAGPKDRDLLSATPYELDDILFNNLWHWLRWISLLLMSVLNWLHGWVGSWGLAILTLAVVVRILIFPIAQVALKKNAKMIADQAKLKPLITASQAQHKGDIVKSHEATMEIYREHGVSPHAAFGGCLPVLIQIPIFIALFNLLGEDIGLRGASFLGIHDLSRPDHLFALGFTIPLLGDYFNLLPAIMAVSMVMVTNLSNPPGADSAQKRNQNRSMSILAVVFFVLFYPFPSGLLLYWITSNLLQFLQQSYVNYAIAREAPASA
jgi:YidC/Oxa1 family membrane protein insertase